jgi:hypothetical protein
VHVEPPIPVVFVLAILHSQARLLITTSLVLHVVHARAVNVDNVGRYCLTAVPRKWSVLWQIGQALKDA